MDGDTWTYAGIGRCPVCAWVGMLWMSASGAVVRCSTCRREERG